MDKQTKNLLIFFAVTFVWTWAFYAPIAAGGHIPCEMPWMILLIFGGMGPSVVGVAMVVLMLDKEARRDFWCRSRSNASADFGGRSSSCFFLLSTL